MPQFQLVVRRGHNGEDPLDTGARSKRYNCRQLQLMRGQVPAQILGSCEGEPRLAIRRQPALLLAISKTIGNDLTAVRVRRSHLYGWLGRCPKSIAVILHRSFSCRTHSAQATQRTTNITTNLIVPWKCRSEVWPIAHQQVRIDHNPFQVSLNRATGILLEGMEVTSRLMNSNIIMPA